MFIFNFMINTLLRRGVFFTFLSKYGAKKVVAQRHNAHEPVMEVMGIWTVPPVENEQF